MDRSHAQIDSEWLKSSGPSLAAFLPDRSARLLILAEGVAPAAATGVIGLKVPQAWVFDRLSFDLLRIEHGFRSVRARLAIALLDRPLAPGTIRIEFLAVDAGVRGQGVGQALIDSAAAKACELGANRLELYVEPENADAQRLYLRSGFQEARPVRETLLRRTLAPQTDRWMIKELTCTTS